MDYYEFKERAGVEISEEQYEMVLTVYLNHPDILDVGDMVYFYNNHGGMGAIELLYPVCRALENKKDCERKLRASEEQRDRLGKLMAVYKKYADMDRMMQDIEIDDIAMTLWDKGVA